MANVIAGLSPVYSTETVTNLTDGDSGTSNYFSNGSRAIYELAADSVFTSFEMDVSFIEASDMVCRVWGGYEVVSNDIPEAVLLCEFPVTGTGTLSDTISDPTAYPFLKITLEDSASGFPSATISEWRANGTASGGPPSSPGAPTFSNITQSGLRVTLPALPSGADSIKLQRSAAGANTWSDLLTSVTTTGATYDDSGLSTGTEYDYRIVAINGSGSTNGSAENVWTAPQSPGAISFISVGQTSVTIVMPALSTGATSLKLQRSPHGANTWSDVATGLGGSANHPDSGLTAGNEYDYRPVAVGPDASTTGDADRVLLLAVAPGAPTFSLVMPTSARITLPALTNGAVTYNLQRSPTGAGDWTTIATALSGGSYHDDSGLTAATGYDYRAVAVNLSGTTNGTPATLYTAPGEAFDEVNLQHIIPATDVHKLRYTVPDPLMGGVTGMKLRVYNTDGSIFSTSSAGTAGQTIDSPDLFTQGMRGYVSIIAVRDPAYGDDFEVDVMGFDIAPARGYTISGDLPRKPEAMALVGAVADTLTFLPPYLPFVDGYLDVFRNVALDAAWGILQRVGMTGLEADTGSNDPPLIEVVGGPNPDRLAWGVWYTSGAIWGAATTFTRPAAPSAPPAPVVTIQSATAADIAGIIFNGDWDSVVLEYGRVGYATSSAAVAASTVESLTGLIANQPYRARFVASNEYGETAGPWTPFTPSTGNVGGGGGTPGNSAPGTPGEVRVVSLMDTTVTLEMPTLPTGADSLNLLLGGIVVRSGLAGGALVTVGELTQLTDYTFNAQSQNLYGTATGPDLLVMTEDEDDQGASSGAPGTPDAPLVEKQCAAGGIRVGAPAWPEGTETMQLRRRVNGGDWATVETWDAESGVYFDTDVTPFSTYDYAVRAGSVGGDSAWSANSSLLLQSSALTLAFQTPAADSTLSKTVTLRVQLTDSGETLDACGGVKGGGPCALQPVDIQTFLDGLPVTITWTKISGSVRNGVYEARFDSRDYDSGERTLRVTAKGSDCCRAKVERTFNLLNTLRRDVSYIEIKRTAAPPSGYEYNQAALVMQNEPLSENPARRFRLKSAVSTSDPETNWESLAVSAETKAAAFDEMQAVTLKPGQMQPGAELEEWHAEPLLAPAGSRVHWVMQLTPEQVMSARLTGCERVAKIERIAGAPSGSGEYFVFADSPAGGAEAKVFKFTYDSFVELAALSEHNAGDAFDAALFGDKLFVIRGDEEASELFAVDLDSGQATLNLAPRGETRAPLAVVTVSDRVLAFFVDDEEDEATRCYDMTLAAPKLLWELEDAVTRVRWLNDTLVVAAGAKLFSTADVSDAPTLVHTFGAAITAMGASDETSIVGLTDGKVYSSSNNVWTLETTLTSAVLATGAWEGAGQVQLAVAGRADNQLAEELLSGAWADARVVAPPAEVEEIVESVTAFARFEKIVTAAQGTPEEPGFVPEEKVVALLIGTAAEGVLIMLELSAETPGSLLVSEPSHTGLSAYQGLIPVA